MFPSKMVIFHGYVSLPEGTAWDMLGPAIRAFWFMPRDGLKIDQEMQDKDR